MFIEQELGNPDLARLCCIMLVKADWQLQLKWHSSYGFLPKCKHKHMLTDAQGGGRKGCSAIDQATQQVIETEVIQLHQWLAMDLFLDAWHCFDLMVEVCHNMASWCHRAEEDYLWLHAQTHCLMKYYVHHKYGISSSYNTFDRHPWHGAGQGAAGAALCYIVLSDTLIDAYHNQIQPWCLHVPTMTITIINSIKAFIDNTAMSASRQFDSFHSLTQHAEHQLQWWHQLIQASRDALNLQKCCCAIYNWAPDKYSILCPCATKPWHVPHSPSTSPTAKPNHCTGAQQGYSLLKYRREQTKNGSHKVSSV